MFAAVEPYPKGADITFCNQEAPSAPGVPVSGYPTFNAPIAFPTDLNKVGCNLVNLANNHAADQGPRGIEGTWNAWKGLKTLAVAGISPEPAEQDRLATFTVGGLRFGFLSYTQCSNATTSSTSVNLLSDALVSKQVAALRSKVDLIIAGMHSCDEDTHEPSSYQRHWARFFAAHGVDIVIGTGPHWLQPVELLPRAGGGKTVVWYSLGNLLSGQLDLGGLVGGIAYMDIDVATKTVTGLSFLPTYMHFEWTPAQKAAQDLLARHNLALYPLDLAAGPLKRSLNDTTVGAQAALVTRILNADTRVMILTSATAPKLSPEGRGVSRSR